MARLIDADAFIERFKKAKTLCAVFPPEMREVLIGMYDEFIEEIGNQPTVDAVEVVHGRWLSDMEEFDDDPAVGIRGGVFQTGWKCSICGRSEPAKEPYCNCGAKMDGDGNGK